MRIRPRSEVSFNLSWSFHFRRYPSLHCCKGGIFMALPLIENHQAAEEQSKTLFVSLSASLKPVIPLGESWYLLRITRVCQYGPRPRIDAVEGLVGALLELADSGQRPCPACSALSSSSRSASCSACLPVWPSNRTHPQCFEGVAESHLVAALLSNNRRQRDGRVKSVVCVPSGYLIRARGYSYRRRASHSEDDQKQPSADADQSETSVEG